MPLYAYDGVVENGKVRFAKASKLPDNTPVTIVVENPRLNVPVAETRRIRPRLLYPEDAVLLARQNDSLTTASSR